MTQALPDDATIEQVAEAFGVEDRVKDLTPAARRLTKGQMVSMLGVDDAEKASLQFAVGARPNARHVEIIARAEGLELSVHDIQSVERVFGGADAFPPEARSAMLANVSERLRSPQGLAKTDGGTTNYYCCCPCCCATAVIEPASPTVA